MKRKHDFDTVYDSQEMFRMLLEGISNPGRIVNISKYMAKFTGHDYEHLTIAMTLLDNEVSFNTCKNSELADKITSFTLSKNSDADTADYIFLTEKSMETAKCIIETAKYGTLKDPHKSATVIFSVESFFGITNVFLKGPGINGLSGVHMDDYAQGIMNIRDNMYYEYPTGIDLLFVTGEGQMLFIPRSVMREVRK
jgi:alpha-D-ribose 1-methylphosphonate 5-triphosphate synthase subunit PhnH